MDSMKAHWAYLLNCSQSLILDHGYWTSDGGKDPEDIVMVRLSSLLLKSLDQIGSCRALRICILADNFLTRIGALMACTHLVKLDLKGNQTIWTKLLNSYGLVLRSLYQLFEASKWKLCSFLWRDRKLSDFIKKIFICVLKIKVIRVWNDMRIVQLPEASCWSHLKELQLLYLHDNNMSTWNSINGLSGCLNLTALTLYDTPLSLKKNYRHCLVNNIWSLKALDNFVISDEEIIQNWSLPFKFKAMKQQFCVSLYPSTKSDSFETEMKAVHKKIAEINRIHAFYSPTLIIQRWIRGYFVRKSFGLCSTKKLIASGKPLISTSPVRKENEQEPSQSEKTTEEDTDDNHQLPKEKNTEIKRLHVNLNKLMQTVYPEVCQEATNAESFDCQQDMKVPCNTPKCRSLKSEVLISTFDQDTNATSDICNEEIEEGIFRVLGLKALVHQSEPLRDMLCSRKVVGQDIREAISHFHTQRPGLQHHSPVITSGKRLIGRCPDNISLTPFKFIERAHESFDKARMQRQLSEKVTECHIDREVAKGRRYDFMEARRTDVRLRQEREWAAMEKTLTLQRAKLEQDVHHARQKHAQFLEEKRRRIQEQEMVCSFSQQHNSLARAVLRYSTWKRGHQQ